MTNTTPTFEPTFEEKTLNELWAAHSPFVFDAPRRRETATWTNNELIFVHHWYRKADIWAIAWAIGRSYQAVRSRKCKLNEQVKDLDLAACPTKEVINPGARIPVDALKEHRQREAPYEAAVVRARRGRLTLNPRPKGNTRGPLPGTKAKARGAKKTPAKKTPAKKAPGKKAPVKKTPTKKKSTPTSAVAAPASPLHEDNTDSAMEITHTPLRQYTAAEVHEGYLGLPAYQPPAVATMDATASAARGTLMPGQVNVNSGSNSNGNAMEVDSSVTNEAEKRREEAEKIARFRAYWPHGHPWEL